MCGYMGRAKRKGPVFQGLIRSNMLISPRRFTRASVDSSRTVHAAMGVRYMNRWKWGEKKRGALIS